MKHEHKTSLEQERSPELSRPIFDLGQMAPDQVADLITAIGAAIDTKLAERSAGDEHRCGRFSDLILIIGEDLKSLSAHNTQNAMELYTTLINHPALWPCELAADFMGAGLLQQQLDDPNGRQQVIEPWMKLLDHQSEFVREAAERSIAEVANSDWIDEPTAHYLNSKLPKW